MNLTGIGLYSLKEAERLTGASARDVSRWLFGYRFPNGASPPLWKTQLVSMDDKEKAIGFRDLLELRIVKQFLDHHVSLPVIRAAIANARTLFHTDYPFTANRFLTDGKSIFYEAVANNGEGELTDLAKRQLVFEHIIRPELYAGIEFDDHGEARRWYPVPRNKQIVLDPAIAFGKPILAEFGIRTNVIAQSYAVEQDKKTVATLFNIPVAAVDTALRYERTAA